MAERLIRIAKAIILKGFEILQLASAVLELTKKVYHTHGFHNDLRLSSSESCMSNKNESFLKTSLKFLI